MKLNKYRLYCETEAAYQHTWRDETQGAPTACPNNSAHVITAGSVVIVETSQNMVVDVAKQPEPLPFAQPTHRTKRDATASLVAVNPGAAGIIDYKVAEERFCTGGTLLVENQVFGDWVSAEIHDVDGVIPLDYRASLCEAWPTVAVYVIKEWVDKDGKHEISTYPLNAKISPGLYLRVTYNAVAEGVQRRVGITYNLTKKL